MVPFSRPRLIPLRARLVSVGQAFGRGAGGVQRALAGDDRRPLPLSPALVLGLGMVLQATMPTLFIFLKDTGRISVAPRAFISWQAVPILLFSFVFFF